MILIADSGSTKTDWRLIGKEITQYRTEGLNPNYTSENKFIQTLQASNVTEHAEHITQVYFYSSGCGSEENKKKVSVLIKGFFYNAQIEVLDDLLGAARGVIGNEKGVCCILGTGAHACIFDGKQITNSATSLGYVLGDEGSGYDLGKRIIKKYFSNQLPEVLKEKFENRYHLHPEDVVENLYNQEKGNAYIAEFSKFLFDNRKEAIILEMIQNAFKDFITHYIEPILGDKDLPIHFVGSVAFYYNDIIRKVFQEKGYVVGKIIETPIAGLTLYHSER